MDSLGVNQLKRLKEEARLQDLAAGWILAILSGLTLFGLTAQWPEFTHDDITHLRRIEALTDAFRAGVIFPRWFPDLMFGYGAPVLNYYPFGSYYPPAVLHVAGLDLLMSVRVAFSLGFALSAWWMYRLGRLYFSLWPAVVSVVCFQFFPYRIHDLFVRGAFPEFSAFFWLPAIALYTLQAATLGRESSRATSFLKSLALAGLAWAVLIPFHNLSALMAVLLLGALTVLVVVFGQQRGASLGRILVSSFAPLGLGMLLSAWYISPALLELDWVMNGDGLFSGFGREHFRGWGDLVNFNVFYSYFDPTHRPQLAIYVIPTVLAALLAAPKMRSRKLRLLTVFMLVLTLGLSWLMTDTSAWLWYSVEPLFDLIQFPWRWQIFVSFGVALLLAASLESFLNSGRSKTTALPLVSVLISIYIVANATVSLDYNPREEGQTSNHWYDSIETWTWFAIRGPVPRHLYPLEFTKSIDKAIEAGRSPWEDDSAEALTFDVAVTPTHVGLLRQRYMVEAERPFRLLFHQFNFPAWRVTIDGVEVEKQPATGLSLASVEIPSGTHAVDFSWKATTAVWIGRIVTASGWIVVFILLSLSDKAWRLFGSERGSRMRAVKGAWPAVAWLLAGAFMVVSASSITARSWEVTNIGADYDNIRLEGVRSLAPVRAGEVASIRLIWLAKGPGTPLSTFVHLVGGDGMGVSQHDGPPGGEHTHYKRWTPGLILYSTHNITVPDTLPPGSYRLIAGLYYPDHGHEPIAPSNGGGPRLELGVLKVLP